ncbi:uncharacterized protein LOC128725096 [Anopheles nili]|uniref:uncharacterized protein LOC128725096 n=1 Tax=Anopheles nili TaxID=185578 RepID=UPI00237C12AA|nr:uncharacterized protein LOC128725096 [Anopheles nili]
MFVGIILHDTIVTAISAHQDAICVPGVLTNASAVRLRLLTIPGICDGTKDIVCYNCNTLRVCLGTELGQETMVACPGNTPYCNYGTSSDRCSTVPIPNVCDTGALDSPLTCSAVGILPDAGNCQIYHGCIRVGQSSSIYTCPAGYVFNAALELCAIQNVFSKCVTMQCATNYVGHVRYGLTQKFYGFCDGTSTQPLVFRCPNRASFAFIDGSAFGECIYLCPGQGNYANSNNPATYFQCFWANRRLRYNLVNCPTGLVFNTLLRYCV